MCTETLEVRNIPWRPSLEKLNHVLLKSPNDNFRSVLLVSLLLSFVMLLRAFHELMVNRLVWVVSFRESLFIRLVSLLIKVLLT